MKDIQLFLFDVDGTLIDSQSHQLLKSCVDSLKKLQEQGFKVGISSGRGMSSLVDTEVGNCISWDIYLCNNGQAIYDKMRNPLKEVYIDKENVYKVLEVAKKRKQPVFMVSKYNFICGEITQEVINTHKFLNLPIPIQKPYEDEEIIMMCAYDQKGYDYHDYQNIEGMKAIEGMSTYADLVLENYNKYEGVKYALAYFNLNEYMAFGDSLNDMEMIQNATIGICMGNGCDELKQVAHFVTKDVLDDGIAYALNHYENLIKK